MRFEWDADKAKANRRKHGVGFEDAITAFDDPSSLEIADPDHSADEERFVLIGTSASGRLLVVVHTERGDRIRLVGPRRATWRERLTYERRR